MNRKKKNELKKKYEQLATNDPEKFNFDWGSTNPFANPLFYISVIIFLPVWYFDAVKIYGNSGAAVLDTIFGVGGWVIVFFVVANILKFLFTEAPKIADDWEREKKRNEAVKKHEAAKKKHEESKSKENVSSPGASGSAFFIDGKGHLITNNHVIKGFENRAKIFYDNEEVKLKFIACDEQLDLALLKANVKNEDFIEVADKVVKKMQNIVAAGYPLGKHLSDDLKFTSGIVSSLKGPGNNSAIMQIDAALNPGNSGGPIVDKEKGHLTGVAVSGLRKDVTEGINYGIKVSRVKEFLESNRVNLKHNKKSSKDIDVSDKLENSTVYIFTY